MICRRCSTPLPPYAERCGRCGAPAAARTAGSAASIASDPPPPMTIELEEEEAVAPAIAAPAPRVVPRSNAPAISAQLFAWAVDLFILVACAGLHVLVAKTLLGARVAGGAPSADYWLDLLLRGSHLPLLWAGVAGVLAVAYSWLFAFLGGRTPGLALAGLRLESVRGGSLSIDEALLRAALAIPSAALGLAGFALALLDPRGQTLHDKLCGTVVVRAPA